MLNFSNILYDNENLAGPDTGAWATPHCRESRSQIPINIDIVGTASVVIEGADVTSEDPIALCTNQAASTHLLVDSKVNLRARIVSATAGAKVRVTADIQLVTLSADRFSSNGIG